MMKFPWEYLLLRKLAVIAKINFPNDRIKFNFAYQLQHLRMMTSPSFYGIKCEIKLRIICGKDKDMYANERWDMVNKQLRVRGVSDERVLQSMNSVPRHLFVPSHLVSQAYDDNPLPIGNGQTISQPYIVATMAESALVRSTDKVLEIGTGCGYSAAVLSTLANKVITCEIIDELGNSAKQRLADLKYDNVEVLVEDGSMGFKSYSPFDVIIVTAGAPTIPIELLYQLNLGGRMIIPVCYSISHSGSKHHGERLVRLTRMKTENETESFQEEQLEDVRFVPLRGKAGWATDSFPSS